MSEIILLNLFLSVAFVLAPLMTSRFFLNNSRIYSDAHKVVLVIMVIGAVLNLNCFAGVWMLFCIFGFLFYLKNEYRLLFSIRGLATFIPFLFSFISSAWFFAGINDLYLLGYNRIWSFYAALHASFLGWLFVGCLVFLSRRPSSSKLYLWGCYLSFVFFLFVAFGIDGTPYVKRIGLVGLSLIVPFLIGLYTFSLKSENRRSRFLSALSLFAIVVSMVLAVLNEFWVKVPRFAFGIPIMVFTHGFINTILTIPCFFLAIRFERNRSSEKSTAENCVIFFDDFCVLCNGSVALLIKLDRNRVFRYSSLQGKHAHEVLSLCLTKSGASVIFHSGGISYKRAEAVIHILIKLGGLYKVLGSLLNMLPLFILNWLYDLIARNRYHLFGKSDSCLIPNEEDRSLFLP